MASSTFNSVDEYIAAQPDAIQDILVRVRTAIRQALPEVEEVISYKMPTYKLNGEPVLHLAAWKRHYSLYAGTAGVAAAFQRELAPYEIIKGTIRFPLSQPVPVTLIERIAKFRAREVTKAKAAATKKR
jgi:uncharacterized protein YdhG (YjbR/CyaY superfamily)